MLNYRSSLYSWYKYFIRCMFSEYFLPGSRLTNHFFNGVLWWEKILVLLIYLFSFMDTPFLLCFWNLFKISTLIDIALNLQIHLARQTEKILKFLIHELLYFSIYYWNSSIYHRNALQFLEIRPYTCLVKIIPNFISFLYMFLKWFPKFYFPIVSCVSINLSISLCVCLSISQYIWFLTLDYINIALLY